MRDWRTPFRFARRTILRRAVWPALGLLVVAAGAGGAGAETTDPEARIKAAMVYNFIRVVEWPEPAGESAGGFLIGVVGGGETAAALHALDGRNAGGALLHVREVAPGSAGLRACRLVYLDRADAENVATMLQSLGDAPTLTVSDAEGFATAGGMLQLSRRQNRMRILINPDAASRARLRLSSQLLKIGELVRERRGGGLPH